MPDCFADRIVNWQRQHGRHSLPWQNTQDAYRIWLSEIMLQQTQVATAIPYYERFLQRFPDVQSLAAAAESDVMELWAGLGYYTRARNLHRCAKALVEHWNGRFPDNADRIAELPGIGRSTAGAIAAFAFGARSPILDGNVRRVFARHFGIEGDPTTHAVQRVMWQRAEDELPALTQDGNPLPMAAQHDVMRAYTQGLMDLGATVCTRGAPDCARCPVRSTCVALRQARQHELPTPRARKIIPERSTHMLWISHGDALLLQRRPSSGIWGGLLSLPEFDGADPAAASRKLGVAPRQVQKLTPFVHTFSHYRLTATPWRVEAGSVALRDDEALCWVKEDHLSQAALPAPIRKLLMAPGSELPLF